MASHASLIQPLIERARRDPDRLMLVFIAEDGSARRITAGEFHRDAVAHAHALQRVGIRAEDLVILVLDHSPVLLSAFWGALYLGAIPSIFPFLTEKLDPTLYMERVRILVAHAGARAVITFPAFRERLGALLAGLSCRVLGSDEVPFAGDDPPALPEGFDGAKIAFLQHSSGTTGLQKGVALSHRSVLNQIEACSRAIRLGPDDVIASWLPLYHDMGLIAGFVMPLTAGVPLVLMSPFHWVRAPAVLLRAIHEHGATLCWLPNFAFNHCVRTVRERDLEGVDLGRWRVAINCSEPVRHASHELFLARFAPYGFRREALATSYGMAENVFAATQSPVGEPPRVDWIRIGTYQQDHRAVPAEPGSPGAMPMVSCGPPIPGTEIAVIGGDGGRLPERWEGEIVVRGTSLFTGYYKRPDLTAQTMVGEWYRTGDMGYLADGELYVSGRKKDLIIVGGKNIYPQDLEAIANVTPGIYPGRAVAFGVYDEALGTESVVMVCEVDGGAGPDERRRIAADLRRRVIQQTEVTLGDVRLVGRRWVIKTSSGKIARADNRQRYLSELRPGPGD